MYKYNFDKMTDRKGTGSYKWDDCKNAAYPLWVADMDFEAAPPIRKALEDRVAHGIFGYNIIPDNWYDSYISWWDRRHNFKMEKDWLVFCTGVVPAISSTVRKLTEPGDNVVILTPVYNIFFNSIINNGCNVCEVPLIYRRDLLDNHTAGVETSSNLDSDCITRDIYTIDFDNMEKVLSDDKTKLLIFCNPHNPVGRIWSADELRKVGELCAKHNVTVLSDEIHCDLTDPGKEYVPFASVSETCKNISITAIAPTKAFNIAGMQTAAVSIPNLDLRKKIWRALNTDEVAEPNSFAIPVTIAAFNEGEPWLLELRRYIFENKQIVKDFLSGYPKLKLIPSEATYLLWIDCNDMGLSGEELSEKLIKETGVYLTAGEEYGKSGAGFLRMNIACPRKRLEEALELLNKVL
ncbi:MAG: pyridoxal phosphate-dependent aminotransferase [Lachnospiraceae bacterium]|nr:pyridoxal phosphate-dependent aminotransferase [Lachnospiraceae bacterium]